MGQKNYTDEQINELVNAYLSATTDSERADVMEEYEAKFYKSLASIRSLLVIEHVYIKPEPNNIDRIIEEDKATAIRITNSLKNEINNIEHTLARGLEEKCIFKWDSLIDNACYPDDRPVRPILKETLPEPKGSDKTYQPNFSFIDKLFPKLKIKKEQNAHDKFIFDYDDWKRQKIEIQSKNRKLANKYLKDEKFWDDNNKKFEDIKKEKNASTVVKRGLYKNKEKEGIVFYCDKVLKKSEYPPYYPNEWCLDFKTDKKILIVDYSLPDINCIPSVKEVKYLVRKNEFSEVKTSKTSLNKFYNELLYQISLRTIYELFEADTINAIELIVFNGWVDSMDKSIGKNIKKCLLSLSVTKDNFSSINLAHVDTKLCFKGLKGVSSSKLQDAIPINPIITSNIHDDCFLHEHEASNDNAISYDKLNLNLFFYGINFVDIVLDARVSLVDLIVNAESPIHQEELMRRSAEGIGVKKLDRKSRDAILEAVNDCIDANTIKMKGEFIWLTSMTEAKVRDRSELDESFKSFNLIPPEEIYAAIQQEVNKNPSSSRESIISNAASALGFGYLTKDTQQLLEEQLNLI